ncbi:MAG TPA: electron transfer flavoprotein subunit beta/FixA family protein [Bacillota bacterium]|nr:electron transfer flavoprotein subunit beta/FixA family protein [Bacillota bacterium]
MNIAVCIKPVPDPRFYGNISVDPRTGLLVRKGAPAVINPSDRNAIEAALQLKERHGGRVVLASMAPPDAGEALKEGLAMGADEAFLLSDPAFAGADTLATARVLAAGLNKIGRFDLILTGCESADGGTAHVPSQLGEMIGFPHLNHVQAFYLKGSLLHIEKKTEDGFMEYRCRLPAVLGVTRDINTPRYISLTGVAAAQAKPFTVWGLEDLGLEPAVTGLTGSPTQPGDLRVSELKRKVEILRGEPEEIAEKMVTILRSAGVLD